jgi:hypothetical protein
MAILTVAETRRLRKIGHGRPPRFGTQASGPSKMPAGKLAAAGHMFCAAKLSEGYQLVRRREASACLARQAGPGPRI